MIKPLLLNTYDANGGAAIATYRLHKGLQDIGLDSKLLVQQKSIADDSVFEEGGYLTKYLAQIRPNIDKVPLILYKSRLKLPFSSSVVPDNLIKSIGNVDPDIVHLFWIAAGFAKIESLAKIKKPIVWTLHDMWPFTGGCHYDNECGRYESGCGNCPLLNSRHSNDLTSWNVKRKLKSWDDLPITVVATSHWLADCARRSSVFSSKRVEIIPNGIDCNKYRAINKSVARDLFNLPQDKLLVFTSAFSAADDPRKGFKHLISALQRLASRGWADKVELVILGASSPKKPLELGMKTHYIGRLNDEVSQVMLYSAADIFVAPSIQENLANTVMESLACSLPVAAFNIGGMPDMIKHKSNGYLADALDSNDLADGIVWILEDMNRHQNLSQNARNYALQNYAVNLVADKYHQLYQDILKCA